MSNTENVDREIRTTAVDFSFGELLNLHNSKEIVIRPEYQRLFRWTNEQRSRLIESIVLGLPIPPIFLIEGDHGVLELIDGLQRTSTVLQFLDHSSINEPQLILSGCDILDYLNGLCVDDISITVRLKIKRTPIRATIINKSGDSFVKYEMFKRLNTGGALLSAQEIRNCSSRMVVGGDVFYDAIQEMAKFDPFIKSISKLPDTFKEKRADEELVLRFFAVTQYRNKFKGNIEEWLDSLMEDTLFERIQFDLLERKNHFEDVFNVIAEKLSDSAFTRFNIEGEPTGRLAPAYYEAVVATFSAHLDDLRPLSPAIIRDRLQNAFNSKGFRAATGPGANTIEKLGQRISIISKYLCAG
jgi:hypothetical protein